MEKKKLAAAMAAVYTYIRTGEEAAAAQAQAADAGSQPAAPAPVAAMNLWGLSGRQAIMNANTMMQMRMFK